MIWAAEPDRRPVYLHYLFYRGKNYVCNFDFNAGKAAMTDAAQGDLNASRQGPRSVALMICMPTRGSICIETHNALTQNVEFPNLQVTAQRLPVVEARNTLWRQAKSARNEMPTGADVYVVWLDDDSWWPRGTISRLIDVLQNYPTIDVIAPSFSERRPFCTPDAYVSLARRLPLTADQGNVVEVEAVGGHFLCHRAALLDYFTDPFVLTNGLSEDYSFFERLRASGRRVAVATKIIVAHIEAQTGLAFIPGTKPGRIQGGTFVAVEDGRSDMQIVGEYLGWNRVDRSYGAEMDRALRKWERTPVDKVIVERVLASAT